MKKILIISIILNLIIALGFLFFIFQKGGIGYIKGKLINGKKGFPASYYHRLNILDKLPPVDSAIVFAGNSIIEQCECTELFQNPKVLNRGISHDNIRGLINRAEQIIKLKPVKLFILIGTNDLVNGLDKSRFENDYREMAKLFNQKLPETKTYLISLLPSDDIIRKNRDIIGANKIIKEISEEFGNDFIDIYSGFLLNGRINPEFSDDGLHLNGKGYLVIKDSMLKLIEAN